MTEVAGENQLITDNQADGPSDQQPSNEPELSHPNEDSEKQIKTGNEDQITEEKKDDLNSMTDEQIEKAIMEMQEKIKQRKQQQTAIKAMIQEQEDEFINVQGRNDVLEKQYDISKRNYDKAERTLKTLLSSKEDLFVKLQKIQSDIDQFQS